MVRQAVGVLFLCVACSGFGQTNMAAFFRITSPSNAIITDFDPMAGTISWSNEVAGVTNQLQRAYVLNGVSNWVDFVQLASTSGVVGTERIIDLDPPDRMVFISGGVFQMGDNLDGESSALPVHSVYVSGFCMDKTHVTKAQWDAVCHWATNNSYSFDSAGSGKASNHPVQDINWFDCVKWCNARSRLEGLVPCYTNAGGSVYTNGIFTGGCDWDANGYRLPTEAEWEKAARGGLNGKRFPWGNEINHDDANYRANGAAYTYDTSPYTVPTYHPSYDSGGHPFTSPVGSFSANGYGVYDMSGNVWEWCWDGYDENYYEMSPPANPRGADSGSDRVVRGGSCYSDAAGCGSAKRNFFTPDVPFSILGFRTVRNAGD